MHRAPEPKLGHPLEGHHRRHRRALLIRHALRGASWSALAITFAVALGLLFVNGAGGAWLRLTALVVAVALSTLAAARGFLSESLSLDAFLERVEQRFPVLRSWIRNAVDFERAPLEHVSSDLAGALRDEASRRLADEPIQSLTPKIAPRASLWRIGAAAAVLMVVALLWPAATTRSWATLWNPGSAAAPIALTVEPGSVTVTPGATLAVRARVSGTDRAPRLDRDEPGARTSVATAEGRDEHGDRVWRFDLAQLTRTQDYWVRVAGARSPRYRISLSGTMAPVSFEVEVHPPAYARMPVQRGTSARGDLMALRGSTASLVVTFDRDLEGLTSRMPDGRETRWTAITPRRWRGSVGIMMHGAYDLIAAARPESRSAAPAQGTFRYRISALPDAPPVLMVQLPQGDVDLPAGQQIPLDVVAQDDLGLTELQLEVRKDPEQAWEARRLTRFDHEPREARVESRWDASALGLLPGQSASFRFVLLDDNAIGGRGRAVSQTFELRFPSLAEMYDKVDEAQGGTQKTLEKAADQARDLQKSLEKMARQQPRPDQSPSTSFERSEEMRSALQRQQEIGKKIDEAAQQLQQSLEQAAERQAFDQDLTKKLQQITELMQQIQSPEFKDALKKMQQALEKMDRQQLDRTMPQWKANNEEMIKSLERTLELLKKLREEEKLQSLGERAEELKAQQDALNKQHAERAAQKQPPKSDLADRQRDAAKESDKLAEEARDAAAKQEGEQKNQVEKAAQDLSQDAAPAQRDAAEKSQEASDEASQQAEQQGKSASDALSSAAQKLKSAAQQQQEQQQQLDLAAVRRAGQDLLSLQRAGENNLSSSDSPSEKANRQTDLSEGTSRVADSLYQLSRESPFISQKLGNSLGHAINNLMSSGKDMASGNRQQGESSARSALQSLNEAVLELRSTENSMCNKPGAGQGKRMSSAAGVGQLGQRQSQLNQETRNLTQRLTEQMRLSAGDRDQMKRLAEEQARIRAELEQIQRTEQAKQELLGRLDQTQKEMKEVEEVLKSGSADDQLEEKQTRILSRLLDAQRSVNRRDYDPQRESRPGEDALRAGPAELPADLLKQNDRFRQDLLKSELDRYPAQYRAFVEAYLRQLNGSRR